MVEKAPENSKDKKSFQLKRQKRHVSINDKVEVKTIPGLTLAQKKQAKQERAKEQMRKKAAAAAKAQRLIKKLSSFPQEKKMVETMLLSS